MRQGSNNQSNRRGRGRGHHHHSKRNHQGNRNQNYDSNGPQGRIRGTAKQVCDKYLQLAKDAISSGDRVLAESFYQHADHYARIVAQFAPKPRLDEAGEGVTPGEGETTTPVEGPETAEAASVDIEIVDGDTDASPASSSEETQEAVAEEEPVVEEKPKRRTTRRAPRKKADPEEPKLGGGTNAVPEFLARPVEVEGAESEPAAPEATDETLEEKPKRKRTTRRKKVEADAPADNDGDEAEVVTA